MPDILLVDDRSENLIALEALLEKCDANIFKATSGSDALAHLLKRDFAVVLLDVQMPEMDGFEVAELMRRNHYTRHIPIIFVTAISKDEQYVFKGYESGAVDYLSKPIEPIILLSKVRIFLDLWSKQHELSTLVKELELANRTILAQKEELQQLAIRDHLTGLYQRRWLDELLSKESTLAIRKQTPLSVAFIDIDFFKHVNDAYGHDAGDGVLVQLAHIMKESIRESDTIFRYGGEEFVLLMPDTSLSSAMTVCERIRKKAEKTTFTYDSFSFSATISIGLAELLEMTPPTPRILLTAADKFLYRAKANGRNRICHKGNLNIEQDVSVNKELGNEA